MAQCDFKVYKNGKPVCVVNSIPTADVEAWVRRLAKKTGQRMDWHSFAGRDVVLTLGNIAKALKAADEMKDELNAIGKKIWDKQLPGMPHDNYVQIQWPPTKQELEAVAARQKKHDYHIEDCFSKTEFVVEATSFESHEVWRRWHETVSSWEQISSGFSQVIGHIKVDGKEMPVCVSGFWSKIDGRYVLFYEATSLVVHYDWVNNWIKNNVRLATGKLVGHCDASNFHSCIGSLGIKYDHTKFKM